MECYLGVDVGTSGTKTLIMAASGRVLATATAPHTVQSPTPGASEQKPQQWWRATVTAVKQAVETAAIPASDVRAISFSGQMHGLVCLDSAGKLLRPAIIWNDQRSASQCQQITAAAGSPEKLIALCGNVAMSSFTLTKLLWLRDNEPQTYESIAHILLPKDYIRYRMTGELAGDISDMSGTMLVDQPGRQWSQAMIDLFDIDKSILPDIVESSDVAGKLTASAARSLGLEAGIPVVAGGGDQPVGAIGSGIVKPARVSATLGTSGVVYIHSRDYHSDPAGSVQTFCSSVSGEYCMFGCVMAAGGSFQWLRNTLGEAEAAKAAQQGRDPYELLIAQARKAAPGCGGVFWLPYLTGERTPHNDPLARAGWIGITQRTGRQELIRSVIEGVTFAMADVLDVMRSGGLKVSQVRLAGGGARSSFWRQLQADIYNAKCATINAEEGPAFGAAILAAVGCGAYKSVPAACEAVISVTSEISPDKKLATLYNDYHSQYRRLYPALAAEFAGIAEL